MVGAITFEPFVGDGWPGDIAAELLEFQTLIGAPAHRRVEAKVLRVDTERCGSGLVACARGDQCRGRRTSADSVGARDERRN